MKKIIFLLLFFTIILFNQTSFSQTLSGATVEFVELGDTKTVNGSDQSLDATPAQATYNIEFKVAGENYYVDIDNNQIIIGARNSTVIDAVNSLTFNFSGGTFSSITGASFNSGASTGSNTSGVSASFTATSVTISGIQNKDFAQGYGLGNMGTVVFDITTAGVANNAPVIAATSAGQTVNDNSTLTPFSAITILDADGDNLSATITLDNHAKGVLTGAGLSGTGPYTIASTSPADLQTKLRALSYNPTDNRAAVSETTTFTVLVDDGTDTDSDNTTTVISNAVTPTVTSVTVPTNTTYVASQNLNFTVNFSENVTVSGSPQISITIGAATQQAVYISGSGSSALTFSYAVQTGDLDTNGITVNSLAANGGTIRDSGFADANLTLNSVGSTTAVLVDAVAPTITSVIVPANATYIANQNLNFTVNFSENVIISGTPQLSITLGSATQQATYISGSNSSALVFRYTIQTGDLDTNGITVNSLSANGGTLRDTATNDANLTLNSVGSTTAVLVDTVVPTITSVTVPSNGTYTANQNLDFTVNFNENITVNTTGGTPQIAITIGSTTQQAAYVSGSGSSALLFRNIVQNGDNDIDGITIGSLSTNGGTLKDVAGNDANLTLNSVGATTGVLVETPKNNSLNFDGTNDQVDLTNNLNTTIDNLNTFTVEAIVRPETNTGLGVIVGNYNNGTNNMQFLLRRDNANYTFWVDDGSGFKNATATGAVVVNTWTHIAGVWDGSELRIYINGTLTATTTGVTGASFISTTNPIKLGFNNVSENFNGDIDEVRIWSDVRTQPELDALKNIELNGGEDNLLGYYSFNQANANENNTGETSVLDLSSNNNNGTLSNFNLSGTSSNWVVGTPIETIPVIQNVTVPGNATYISGQNLDFTLNFSEIVNVVTPGSPEISLTVGSTTRQAIYTGGSGTKALSFRYITQTGDLDTDGINVGTLIANNGSNGTIKDTNNNDVNLKLISVASTSSILVNAVAPTLNSSNPADNSTNIIISSNIELTFSENVSKGIGNIVIKKTSDDSTVETIDVTTAAVSISSNVATINPTSDLDLNTEYYIQIANTAFKDAANNNYIGISDTTSLSFTTEANQTNTFVPLSGNWSDSGNWSLGRAPISSDNIVVDASKTINYNVASATVNNITINTGGTLNILSGNALTIDGNLTQNGTFNILSNATTNGSLILNGTHSGIGLVTYLRHLTTNWHLISSPVDGLNISDLSGFVNTSGIKYAIAPYVNNVASASRWDYYTTGAGTNDISIAGFFETAKGYSIQKNTVAGTVAFSGFLNTDNKSISITDGGDDPAGNRWNLVGNTYTAALNGNNAADATNNFLKVNIDAGNLDPARSGVYLWNGSTPYDIKSVDDAAFYIAPGQGFFVHAPDGGGTSVSITEAMQKHQTGNVFLKNTVNYPEIIMNISDNTQNASTKIRYIENRTTGLDIGSDVGTFNGDGATNFSIYSHLISESKGVSFAIQALPNSDYENMIIPIGVNAEAGKELKFSLDAVNFTSEIKIYLEDKLNNTFTRLDEANSNYTITLSEKINGIGRFYLHTTSSTLSLDNDTFLENISMYKLDNTTLRVAGLFKGKASIKLFSILGKEIVNTSFTTNGVKDISIPKTSAGVYLVQLETEKGQLNRKIILD